jgi:hypothetical protein
MFCPSANDLLDVVTKRDLIFIHHAPILLLMQNIHYHTTIVIATNYKSVRLKAQFPQREFVH